LVSYSTSTYRSIDSIVLEVTDDILNYIPGVGIFATETNRVVLEDNMGIPIKASTWEP
jgi:hypothetical protein